MNSTAVCNCFLELKYQMSSLVNPSATYSEHFVKEIEAKVFASNTDNKETPCVGQIAITILKLSAAINRGVSLEEIFDFNDDLLSLGNSIYDNNFQKPSLQILSLYPEAYIFDDIIFIDYAFLIKEVRGKRILPSCIFQILFDLGTPGTFIFLKPDPFQFYQVLQKKIEFTNTLGLEPYSSNQTEACKKIIKYLCSCGFKEIPLTDTVVLYNEDVEARDFKLESASEFILPKSIFNK